MREQLSPSSRKRWRSGMSLVEVMIASLLCATILLTTIGSAVFYRRTTHKNDRVAMLANLMESRMEHIKSFTWFALADPAAGIFPLDGVKGGAAVAWPSHGGPFSRYRCNDLSYTLVKDGTIDGANFSGLGGRVEVFYTPITIRHDARSREGSLVHFDVNYYKVELVVTLDESSRVRPGEGEDRWLAVTYLSELTGSSAAAFSQAVNETLETKKVEATGP